MVASFDYNYQNAFHCNLCNVDLCHARATSLRHIRTKQRLFRWDTALARATPQKKKRSSPQSILEIVVK